MLKKNIFFCLLCLCLFGCSSQKITYNTNNSSYLLNSKNDCFIQVFNNTLAIIETKSKIDSFTGDVLLYDMKQNEYLTTIHLKEGMWQTGILKEGYYAIDLKEKKIYCYDLNKKTKQISPNLSSNDAWTFAMLSEDSRYLVYGESKSCGVFLHDLNQNETIRLCGFSGTWESLYYDNDCFYLKNAQDGELICVDTKTKCIASVFANRTMSYIAPYYSAYTTDDKLVVYDVNLLQEKDILLSNKDEAIIGGVKEGIVTINGEYIHFYNMKSNQKFSFIMNKQVKDVKMNNMGKIMVLTTDNHLLILDENNAHEINEIEYTIKRTMGSHLINAPTINQNPEYPTGCESVSTVMLLQYLGENITVASFLDNYLQASSITEKDGVMYASNPNIEFVGNPRSVYSYGCMAPVIKKALIKYYGSSNNVIDTTGQSLENLCVNYISKNQPVIIWATMGMVASYPSSTWITPEGEKYTWLANEHCLLLVGYDDYNYYFNDPLTGRVTKYNRQLSEKRYKELGMQSLTISGQ